MLVCFFEFWLWAERGFYFVSCFKDFQIIFVLLWPLFSNPLIKSFVVNPFSSPSSNRFPRKMLSILKLLEIHASFTAHLPPVVGPLEKPRKTARKRKLTITNRDAKTERRKRKRKKMQGKPENRARNWNCRLKSGTGLRWKTEKLRTADAASAAVLDVCYGFGYFISLVTLANDLVLPVFRNWNKLVASPWTRSHRKDSISRN